MKAGKAGTIVVRAKLARQINPCLYHGVCGAG